MIWIQTLDRMHNLELTRKKNRKHRKELGVDRQRTTEWIFLHFFITCAEMGL
jgi:hypothetical protein